MGDRRKRLAGWRGRVPSGKTAGDALKLILFAAAVVWVVSLGSSRLTYNWQWYRVPRYLLSMEDGRWVLGPLLQGVEMTALITMASFVLSSLLGLTAAMLRLSGSFAARMVARGYLELIRNTPLLVQLFFIYFVLSPVLGISRFSSAVLALSLFEGAYASEIIRAGILAVPHGQWEAARSIGLSRYHAYRYVILPQALRAMLPALISQAVSLIKDSALVSTIAIYDITMKGQEIIAETYMVFEVWFIIAALYLVPALSLSLGAHVVEKRMAART